MIRSAYPATNAEFLRDVLGEFIGAGSKILDANAGPRRMWGKLMNQSSLDAPEQMRYDVTWLDIRKLPGITVRGSDRALPFVNGGFDCVIFDPPYSPGGVPPTAFNAAKKHTVNRLAQQSAKWFEAEITSMYDWKGFKELIRAVAVEFYRVIKPRGYLVMKSAEFREGRETFPTTAYAWTKWNQLFGLEAWLVQVIPVAGSGQRLVHTKVSNSHNTWTVWRHKRL